MAEKPSSHEEEYFARREAELVRQRRETAEEAVAAEKRRAHYMKCPKCGYDLVTGTFENVEIDQCTHCHGIWFDAGEAESLVQRDEHGPIGSVLRRLLGGLGGRSKST